MADYIRPTPRNPILGLLADALTGGVEYMRDPRRAQQMQGLGGLLAETGIPAVVERLSYGEPLTTGRGMTTRLRPEAEAALMTLGPEAVPIGRGAMAAVKATKGLPVGAATVYHGSPYRFQRFDPTKIGSGEGAQAYGYGHYVAESPKVADEYRMMLSPHKVTGEAAQDLANYSLRIKPKVEEAINYLQKEKKTAINQSKASSNEFATDEYVKQYDDAIALLRSNKGEKAGSLYTIDLPDPAIARMLDWDKPLVQQSAAIRQQLSNVIEKAGAGNYYNRALRGEKSLAGIPTTGVTGEKLYKRIADVLGGDQIASDVLRSGGLTGIRYLDAASRNAKSGTSNFVVFPGEEDLLRILSVDSGLLGP
jgi:hypothetical protein